METEIVAETAEAVVKTRNPFLIVATGVAAIGITGYAIVRKVRRRKNETVVHVEAPLKEL